VKSRTRCPDCGRGEKALLAVVPTARVQGVSTRRVDDLLRALGLTGIEKPAQDAVQGAKSRAFAGSWTSSCGLSAVGRRRGAIRICGWMLCTLRCGRITAFSTRL
jgi:hypothetical protein